ncbi:MAG: PBECR2 nuclease fold domain-containing protein [Candidatus Methanoperedens sp.]|nr:PBECR2 nuclease fold domain-containing protein [Candidatus Methanoperedens sp.]MCZ7370752.1 PBECR2 nuclease fold domain-containing protein [Candidatus Methanoperedens sp.]
MHLYLYKDFIFKVSIKEVGDFLVDVIDVFEKSIRLTEKRLEHILKRPEMSRQLERIKETLANPDLIKESNQDSSVWLFYRFYNITPVTEKYLLVAVRLLDGNGFIITAFYTDRIKKGTTIWEK